jgi:AcrR family transcriptional regulator
VPKTRLAAQDRKLAIVTAALPLFARKGFAETTTKDLARAAGISEPLLYRHFPSKEALYLEIQNFTCRTNDPVVKRLSELEPSTSTLVHLIYYLTRVIVLGKPAGIVDWDTRHRLMLNSLLADGAFARLLYQTRFEMFCRQIQGSLCASCGRLACLGLPAGESRHRIPRFARGFAPPERMVLFARHGRDGSRHSNLF